MPKLKMKLNYQDPILINAREDIITAHKALGKTIFQSNHDSYAYFRELSNTDARVEDQQDHPRN